LFIGFVLKLLLGYLICTRSYSFENPFSGEEHI